MCSRAQQLSCNGRASTPNQLLPLPQVMQQGLSFSLPPHALALLLIREEQLWASNSHSVLSSCRWYFGAGSSFLLLSQPSPAVVQRSSVPGLPSPAVSPGQLWEGHQECEEFILLETTATNRGTGWRWRRNRVFSSHGGRRGDGKGLQLLLFQ